MGESWFLTVFFLLNGAWVLGGTADAPGWAPRAYETEEVCLERRDFSIATYAEARARNPQAPEARFVCGKGAPASSPDSI